MREKISALLVHDQDDPFRALKLALESQGIQTRRVRSCNDAFSLLVQPDPPALVFTDTELPDGTWAEMLSLAVKACDPVCVIVVSRFVDIKLYIEVIERGAFDFIVPPFGASDLSHIVRCAVWSTHSCKGSPQTQAA